MSKVDEMFKELGYDMTIINERGIDTITFRKKEQLKNGTRNQIIEFNNRDKELYIHNSIGAQEYIAIHQKILELGWLDE